MKAFAAAAAFVFAATAGTATALCAEDVPPPWAWGFTTPHRQGHRVRFPLLRPRSTTPRR